MSHRSPDSGELQCKPGKLKKAFDPTLRAGGWLPGKAYKLAHVEKYKSGVVEEVKDLKGPFKVLIYPPSLGREAFFLWMYSSVFI